MQRKTQETSVEPAAKRKGEVRRQQIVDMAKAVLLQGGVNAVVLRDVAERLEITHGNLQYYFPTRHELLVAIFDQEIARYTGGMKEAVAATTSRRGRLGAIIDSGLELLRAPETALWRMMIGMIDHNPEMAALHKKENRLYEDAIADELKFVAPELPAKRRRHIAKIILAMLDGLSIQLVHEKPDSPELRAVESEIKAAVFALVEAK